MYFDLKYDRQGEVNSLIIRPDDSESPDELHKYAKMLLVCNPAVQFSKAAKRGEFNDYSDDEYSLMLNSVKEFVRLFFGKNPYVNVFQLLADMSKYIFQNYCFKDMNKPDNEQEGGSGDNIDEDDDENSDDDDDTDDMFA
ncbi:MAG: hypothetical protein K6E19_11535 [Lachnospiraceae bacterium]|nr:hypothetical protein [Lachnospiraceae bacterium]